MRRAIPIVMATVAITTFASQTSWPQPPLDRKSWPKAGTPVGAGDEKHALLQAKYVELAAEHASLLGEDELKEAVAGMEAAVQESRAMQRQWVAEGIMETVAHAVPNTDAGRRAEAALRSLDFDMEGLRNRMAPQVTEEMKVKGGAYHQSYAEKLMRQVTEMYPGTRAAERAKSALKAAEE